jgi:hypothetical protein
MLDRILGDGYEGVISSDYYVVYVSYGKNHPKAKNQFCLSHLARDFKYCAQYKLGYEEIRRYGEKGEDLVGTLIHEVKQLRKIEDQTSDAAILARARVASLVTGLSSHSLDAPDGCPKASGRAKRFRETPDGYFEFVINPIVDPTNNEALCEKILNAKKSAMVHK